MSGPPDESTTTIEELPEDARTRRLRYLVTILTSVLIVGMMVVATTIVWRLTRDASNIRPPSLPVQDGSLPIGEGEEITNIAVDGDRELILHLRNRNTGEEKIIFYLRDTLSMGQTIKILRKRDEEAVQD